MRAWEEWRRMSTSVTEKPFGAWDPAVAAGFIEEWEGRRLKAYRCSAGVWTIGVGHTAGVVEGQTCTNEQADAWLLEDIRAAQMGLARFLNVEVTEGQFVALVSLAFNVGATYVAQKCPKLMRAVNNYEFGAAEREFLDINRAGGRVVEGLTRRRQAEAALFIGAA